MFRIGLSPVAGLLFLAGSGFWSGLAFGQSPQDDCLELRGTGNTLVEDCPARVSGAPDAASPTRAYKTDSEFSGLSSGAVKSDRGEEQLFLTTGLIGQSVYASDGTKAGEVADVLLSSRFQGVAAVVKVGGFLWLGGKDITVPVERITLSRAEDGTLSLKVASTPDQLQASPDFDRTALKR